MSQVNLCLYTRTLEQFTCLLKSLNSKNIIVRVFCKPADVDSPYNREILKLTAIISVFAMPLRKIE
ncbi:hypothetical protein DRQ26_01155 [bacterium]|nr:MAG: hypothetical protein DRQ26_01155 [bacterium]